MIEDTLAALHNFELTKETEIVDFVETNHTRILIVKAILKDNSVIHVRERISPDKVRYSYHWQDKNNQLILRFDNAPHHSEIETHPHHQHSGGDIQPLQNPTFDNFLEKVRNAL